MKKASWSLFVLFVVALLSAESFAQGRGNGHGNGNGNGRRPEPIPAPIPAPIPGPQYPGQQLEERIEARIQQSLIRGQSLRLSQFLYARERNVEVLSLTITAQSLSPRGNLQVLSRGTLVEVLQLSRQTMQLPVRARVLGDLEDLQLTSLDEVYIESVTAQVRSRREPDYGREIQVGPNTLITVHVNKDINGGEVPLARLVKEQMGLTLQGAQIERVAVEGMPIGRVAPSVHVEINNRIASQVKYLSAAQRRLPLQVTTLEEVQSLRLVVSGPARILDVNIRIGNVRPQYPAPRPIPNPGPIPPQQFPTRILVNQELSPSYPLDLAVLTRELSQVRSLTLETQLRSTYGGEITLISRQGITVGRAQAIQGRTVIYLTQPTALSEIRIYSQTQVRVGQIEAELERFGNRF